MNTYLNYKIRLSNYLINTVTTYSLKIQTGKTVDNAINEVQMNLDNALNDIYADIITIDESMIVDNYYVTKTGVVISQNSAAYCKVLLTPNRLYAFFGYVIWDYAAICFYDDNDNFIKGYSGNDFNITQATHVSVAIYTPSDTSYALVSYNRLYGLPTIKEVVISNYQQIYYDMDVINTTIDAINEKISNTEIDYTYNLPDVIYAVNNDSGTYAREYVQYMSIEGIIREQLPIVINDYLYSVIKKQSKNTSIVETSSVAIKLSGDNYVTKNDTLSLIAYHSMAYQILAWIYYTLTL